MATLQRYSVHTPGLIEGFLGGRGGEKKVREGIGVVFYHFFDSFGKWYGKKKSGMVKFF